MKIIYNRFLPVKGYSAMVFFGVILARRSSRPPPSRVIRHEEIHRLQAKECGWLRFYIRYLLQVLIYGYFNSPFEREARYVEYVSDEKNENKEIF